MANRHRFSPADVSQYFDRISLPEAKRVHNVSSLSDGEQLAYLSLVQKHQLAKVPWENLTQHYSWHHVINVKPRHLFRKIVHQPGRGGYCMEANYFFHLILWSLGFDAYMAGSRIYHADTGRYGGWTHVVNIISIAGVKYFVDGGYGAPGPSCPVALEHDVVTTQIAPAESRLLFQHIGQNLNPSQRVWVYESRYNQDSPWVPCYCFPDLEFIPEDIESMNFEPWLNRQTFFTHQVVAVRFTTDREEDGARGPGSPDEAAMEGELDGAITLDHDTLKWRRRGKKVVHLTFQSEADRVAAIGKYFGITFDEDDRDGIKGTAAAVGAK